MKVLTALKKREKKINLATKITAYYFLLSVPILLLLGICLYSMWDLNQEYGQMIETAETASEFSLDFKNEFDYEVYLLVIGKMTPEQTNAFKMLDHAEDVVSALEKTTENSSNEVRLQGMKKYLVELRSYTRQIIDNINEAEDSYTPNYELWEYSVKVNTSMLREHITQVTYYELQGLQKRRTDFQESYLRVIRYSVIALFVLLVIIILLSLYIPRSIAKPVRELVTVTNRVASGDLTIRSEVEGGTEITMLNDSMNVMIEKLNELIGQVREEQKQLRIAEFRVLQAQINPHFLYNTLDTIVWLAEAGDQKKVVSMVGSLSDFFRTSLNQGKDIITLSEELQHVKSYLEIQKVRYQDILTYEIAVPEEFGFVAIPKITLQPLVENALYHGIKNKRGGGAIQVTAYTEENELVICVADSGIGMKPEQLEKVTNAIHNEDATERASFGLYNVNERIRLNFGAEYGLSMESTYGEGTRSYVKLPLTVRGRETIEDLLA